MAAEKKSSFGENFWMGVRRGAGLFAGIELVAFLINPAFAAGLLFYGALGGVVAGSIYLVGKLASPHKSEPAK